MKKISTLIMAIAAAGFATAQSASVVVEKVDNQGLVEGNTYRVYVKAPSIDHTVHAVFADQTSDLLIESTAPFYQSDFGSHSAAGINEAIVAVAPEVAYDSFITLGTAADVNNDLWEAGVNPSEFESGGSLFIEDGAWFVIPTEDIARVNARKLILVAQLTTTGEAHGVLNIQGWDADRETWQARGLEFNTKNAVEFDQDEVSDANDAPAVVTVETPDAATDFQVFPNPVRDNQINIQFNSKVDLTKGNLAVDLIDMSGKVIYAAELAEESIIGGNRLILTQDLAAGVYTVSIRQKDHMNVSQQVVVQK